MKDDIDEFAIILDESPARKCEDAREQIADILKTHPNLTKEQIGHLTLTVAILRGLANV